MTDKTVSISADDLAEFRAFQKAKKAQEAKEAREKKKKDKERKRELNAMYRRIYTNKAIGHLNDRRCHDCGKTTTNYRCPACTVKWRTKYAVDSAYEFEDE